MTSNRLPPTYPQLDDRAQTAWRIDGYRRSFSRSPDSPWIERPQTLTELTGPAGLARRLPVGAADLSRATPDAPRALGELMILYGQVIDEGGAPVAGAMIEMWQANGAGRYRHEYDQGDAPLDPHFLGSARFQADADGRFRVITIKPGAYPVPESDTWWRPPHLHFSIFGDGWMARLVTQMFFPGDPLNESDLLLNSVPDADARSRLILRALPPLHGPEYARVFEQTFVLRGRAGTPALD